MEKLCVTDSDYISNDSSAPGSSIVKSLFPSMLLTKQQANRGRCFFDCVWSVLFVLLLYVVSNVSNLCYQWHHISSEVIVLASYVPKTTFLIKMTKKTSVLFKFGRTQWRTLLRKLKPISARGQASSVCYY